MLTWAKTKHSKERENNKEQEVEVGVRCKRGNKWGLLWGGMSQELCFYCYSYLV